MEDWMEISLQLPTSVHEHLRTMAQQENISISQFIMLAVTEKMAAKDTKADLEKRAKRGSHEKLLAVLAKAPDVEPNDEDKLSELATDSFSPAYVS